MGILSIGHLPFSFLHRSFYLLALCALYTQASPSVWAQNAKITIGDGVYSDGTFDVPLTGANAGEAQVPFDQALAALASIGGASARLGGQIEVLPGIYNFKNTVSISLEGITILGSRAARLRPTDLAANESMFRVFSNTGSAASETGTRFRLSGVTVVDNRSNPTVPLVKIETGDCTIDNCHFDISGDCTADAQTVHILGTDTGGAGRLSGVLVQDNTFSFGEDSVKRIGLKVDFARQVRIMGNRFASASYGTPSSIQNALYLFNCEVGTVSGNTFSQLLTPEPNGDPNRDALFLSVRSTNESGHLAISGNYFEELSGQAIVNLKGFGFCTVTGNAFGRVSSPDGAIRVQDGDGNVIASNQFHRTGTDEEPSILLVNQFRPTVIGNTFLDSRSVEIVVTDGKGAAIHSNQFVAEASTAVTGITLEDVSDAVIGGNSFHRNGNSSAYKDGSGGNQGWLVLSGSGPSHFSSFFFN